MYICKEVEKKHLPAVKAIHAKVGNAVKVFLDRDRETIEGLVRGELLMGNCGSARDLSVGNCVLHLNMVKSDEYTRARSFIANKTTGMSMQLLLSSLNEAEEKQTGLPTHLVGHVEENGAKSWHWEAELEVMELTSNREDLFTNTTAAIVALSIIAKETKTWMKCALTFPETDTADVLPITPSTIYDATTFAHVSSKAYLEASVRYCSRTYDMADLVNMQLVNFSDEDIAANKAEWLKKVQAEEASKAKEKKVEKV